MARWSVPAVVGMLMLAAMALPAGVDGVPRDTILAITVEARDSVELVDQLGRRSGYKDGVSEIPRCHMDVYRREWTLSDSVEEFTEEEGPLATLFSLISPRDSVYRVLIHGPEGGDIFIGTQSSFMACGKSASDSLTAGSYEWRLKARGSCVTEITRVIPREDIEERRSPAGR